MKLEYLEPWKTPYPTKTELIAAWSGWFDSMTEEWSLFTLTVVFKAGGKIPRPDLWESEYKNRVLKKIKRLLERNSSNYEFSIPFEEFYYYEFDEASIFRNSGERKPHHIHALIPIRKAAVYRFWSIDENHLQDRLEKDLYSISSVGSVFVEPISLAGSRSWISYCAKGKKI